MMVKSIERQPHVGARSATMMSEMVCTETAYVSLWDAPAVQLLDFTVDLFSIVFKNPRKGPFAASTTNRCANHGLCIMIPAWRSPLWMDWHQLLSWGLELRWLASSEISNPIKHGLLLSSLGLASSCELQPSYSIQAVQREPWARELTDSNLNNNYCSRGLCIMPWSGGWNT
jgi:hypothetical protein